MRVHAAYPPLVAFPASGRPKPFKIQDDLRFGAETPPPAVTLRKPLWKRLLKGLLWTGIISGSLVAGTGAYLRYFHLQKHVDGPVSDTSQGLGAYKSPTTRSGYNNNPQAVPYNRNFIQSAITQIPDLINGSVEGLPEDLVNNLMSLRLEMARVSFNKTYATDLSQALDAFNPYLHYRPTLPPDKRAAHDEKIRRFAEHPDVQFAFVDKSNSLLQLDKSTQYMIAARLLDLLHNRDDLVEHIIKQDKPLQFFIFENLTLPDTLFTDQHESGLFSAGNANISLSSDSLWEGVKWRGDGSGVDIHEATHAQEAGNFWHMGIPWPAGLVGISAADGLLPGLSKHDKALWEIERSRLFEKFAASNDTSGLGSYAYSYRWEFLAEVVETFYDKPETVNDASPVLYDILKRYYRMDPLKGYRDLP